MRCDTLKVQNEVSFSEEMHKEYEDLKTRHKKLKVFCIFDTTWDSESRWVTNFINFLQEEHDTFRDLADKMIEEKDAEISRLLDDNKHLRQSLNSKPVVSVVCLFACY